MGPRLLCMFITLLLLFKYIKEKSFDQFQASLPQIPDLDYLSPSHYELACISFENRTVSFLVVGIYRRTGQLQGYPKIRQPEVIAPSSQRESRNVAWRPTRHCPSRFHQDEWQVNISSLETRSLP
jgi:hypothetical protein